MSVEARIPRLYTLVRTSQGELEIARSMGSDGDCVLALRGEADISTAETLECCIVDAESLGPKTITLDLEALEFMDSSGLSVLIKAQQRAEHSDWNLLLGNVPDAVRRLLELVGLDAHFALV